GPPTCANTNRGAGLSALGSVATLMPAVRIRGSLLREGSCRGTPCAAVSGTGRDRSGRRAGWGDVERVPGRAEQRARDRASGPLVLADGRLAHRLAGVAGDRRQTPRRDARRDP